MTTLRRHALATTIMAGVLFVAAAGSYAAGPRLEGDPRQAAAVWNTFQDWLQAYSSGDVAGIMAIFDREVVFSFQGSADQSYAELQRGYEADLKARSAGTAWVPLVQQVYADGNLAFVRAAWELRITGASGTVDVKARNQSLDVLRKVGGHWKILRSMNYPDRP